MLSLDEYDRDVIKKHERTRRDKEDDRTRHMLALGAQTGPVFLTYRASGDVDRLAGRVTAGSPLFDFTAPDDVRHTLWTVGGYGQSGNSTLALTNTPHTNMWPLVDPFARTAVPANPGACMSANAGRVQGGGTLAPGVYCAGGINIGAHALYQVGRRCRCGHYRK